MVDGGGAACRNRRPGPTASRDARRLGPAHELPVRRCARALEREKLAVKGLEEVVKGLKIKGLEEGVEGLKGGVPGLEEGVRGLQEGVKGLDETQVSEALQFMLWTLEREQTFTAEVIQGHFRRLSEALGLKLRDLTRPFYVAMSGETASLPLFQSMAILGPDLVRARIRRAIEALGGISGKRMKKLQKRFERL